VPNSIFKRGKVLAVGQRFQASGREAIEDYAKAIYSLQRRGGGSVSTSALAERLDVSPGAVTSMLKKLAELELASYRPYHGVELTGEGERVALEVIRHHRLLESYLADALGMPWDQVHAEAEVLEHYISERLEALIASALDDPGHDPHGDPIPSAELELTEDETRPLTDLDPGGQAILVRVSDSDPGMLRYLADRSIAPGDVVEVVEREPYGGPLRIRVGDAEHALGSELADAIRVAPASDGKEEE
jgi:DtxR family transcriptional regulator, Mn-dependent transcriptional regulator